MIPVPSSVAAKLALYTAMRTQQVNQVTLAELLGVTVPAVRVLTDPDQHSHIEDVETALEALGQKLVVEDGNT